MQPDQIDYDGPDESVECAYPGCINRLRRSDFGEPQFCSKEHRDAAVPVEPQAGQAARKLGGGWEIIGPAECPILLRRTLLDLRAVKVLWHRFMPGASDEAPHDHPRSFVTAVLRGGYDDIQPDGTIDRVYAPAIRYRPATHAHITKVGPKGATTLVVMGPLRREWGFWRDGVWYPWRRFERLFGLNWRCPE